MARRRVRPTRTRGVAKVPVVMQLEELECGAAALAMLMAYYGKWVPLEQVRIDCGVSRDGSTAKNIYLAAEHYGFDVKAYRRSPETIREKGQYPCIVHWNHNHFVVLDGFRGDTAFINDPARGVVKVSQEQFDRSFSGVVIIPVPSEGFEPSGRPKSMLAFARKRLVGTGPAIAFVVLTTAISYLFGIVNSVTSRVYLDRILTGLNPGWLYPFALLLAVLALIQLVVAWAQAILSLRIDGKMSVVGSTSYMWKVMHMPMQFFSQRLVGDVQSRLGLNASISGTLVKTFAPLLLNTVMMVFYLVLMVRQSVLFTAVGLATLLANVAISRLVSVRRMNVARVQMRDAGMLEATTAMGIDMIETIKASGAEGGFFRKWAGYQASVNAQTVKARRTDQFVGMIPSFLTSLSNYVVLLLGVYLAMQGKFTLGSVMMFQGFLGSFMSPAMTLVEAGQTIQEMRTQMERVEDVMEYPEDEVFAVADAGDGTVRELRGEVELRGVTFGYSRLDRPIISDLSLHARRGERIALVGASGCGKSTVSKLVSGLYRPWSGEILFDGRPREAYSHEAMVAALAVVDQDITIFEGTVADNIRMWDETILDFEVNLAARDAGLHDDIVALPGGYQHKLESGGRSLSGGQRQRLEIARALALDPAILILDEATSALDAQTEHEVVEAIAARGATCIVIAHRLSAVRDCDQIIVLDGGKVVERGTHEELMRLRGAYADLVSSE